MKLFYSFLFLTLLHFLFFPQVNSRCTPELYKEAKAVSTVTDQVQSVIDIATLEDETWIAGWEDHRNGASIYGQRISLEGVGLGENGDLGTSPNIDFEMSTSLECDSLSLSPLFDGGWVSVYAVNQTNSRDIMLQRFYGNGSKYGAETLVNDDLNKQHMSPSVTGLYNGGFVVVWTDFRNDDKYSDIYGQFFDADGSKNGNNFLVNDQDVQEVRRNAKIESHLNDATSSFIVFWEDWRKGYSKIFGQLMNGDGSSNGANYELTPDKVQAQFELDVSILKDDGYVIVWQSFGQISQNDIWGIMINSDKTYKFGNDPFEVDTEEQREVQKNPSVTGVFDGGFVVIWEDERDGIDVTLYAMRFSNKQIQVGNEFQISDSGFTQETNPKTSSVLESDLAIFGWQGSHSSDNSGVFRSIYNISYSFPSVENGIDDQLKHPVDSELNYQIPEDAFTCMGDDMDLEASLIDGSDLPSWLTFDSAWTERRFSGMPTGCSQTYNINVTAGCCIDSVNDPFLLEIVNYAVATNQSIPDQEVEINKYYDYSLPDDIFFNNEPNEEVYDLVKLTDGSDLPDWLDWIENEKRFFGQAPAGCSFDLEISIKRNDTCELNSPAEDIFKLQIVNNDPYLDDIIPNQSNLIGETLSFVIPQGIFINDEETEQLTYSAVLSNGDPLPDWLSFGSTERKFTGTAPEDCYFDLEIKVTAEDECATNTPASTIFTWEFTNDPPVVNKEMEDQTYEIGEIIDFLIPADTFNNSETIETVTIDSVLANGDPFPDWLTWDSDNKQYTGKAPMGCGQELYINITAEDGCATNAMAVTQFWLYVTNDQITLKNGMSDRQYDINIDVEYSIPTGTFENNDQYEEIDYQATLSSGDPLPEWLNFDNETLKFSGTTPLGCPLDYVIKIKASDSCNYALDFYNFNITNESPVQNKDLTNQNYEINTQFEYTFTQDTFTNNEQISEPLNYEAKLSNGDPLPDWLNFYSSERKFNGTTPLQCAEILDIQLVITDSCYTLTDEFQFEIINKQPSLINPLSPKSFRIGDQVNFTFPETTFNNPDSNEDLNYEATLTSGEALPDWLTFIANERRFVGDAPFGCQVVYDIIINASDSCSSANGTFKLTILNDEPQSETDQQDVSHEILADFYINIGDSFSNDQDLNEELNFELIQQSGDPIPAWMNFYKESANGTIFVNGTTPEGCQNSWDLKIEASDSCYTKEDLFTFSTTNEMPYLDLPLDDQEFETGEPFEFIVPEESFVNEDLYEDLTYEAKLASGDPLPSWLAFDPAERKFSGTTEEQCPEIFEIIVTVEDTCYSGINDTFNFEIINNPPRVNETIEVQEVYNGDAFEYIFSENLFVNEESFETLTYTSKLTNGDPLPGWLVFTSNERKYSGTSPDGCAIDYEVLIEATDTCLTTNTSFVISVLNEQPILDGTIADQSYQNNDEIDYVFPDDLFINNDLDETLTYSSQLASGDALPDWLTFLPDERRYTGIAPDICGVTLEIELLASDGCLSTPTYFKMQVGNQPPSLDNPIADKTILFDEDFAFSFPEDTFSTDNIHEELTYEAELSNGDPLPDWISFDSVNREFTGHSPDCEDFLEIKVICSDSCTSINDVFELEIQNDPPKLINAIDDQTFQHDTDITFIFDENTFQNNESSKQQFTYEAKLASGDALPDWLSFTSAERKFSGHTPRGCGFALDIYLNASDNCNWDSDSFSFIINNYQIYQNKSIPDQYQFQVNETIDFMLEKNTFINEDTNEEINYEVTLLNGDPLPSWIEFINDQGANEQKFVGQAPLDCSSSIDILINVSDSCSSIQDQFNIEITNSKLTKNKDLSAQEFEVGETFEYIFDIDTWTNDDLYEEIDYQATLSSGDPLPDWLYFDPDERKFHGTAPLQCGDLWEIKVIASDSCEGTESQSEFVFTVINRPIEYINPLVDQEFEVGQDFEYIFATDTFNNPDSNEDIDYQAKLSNDNPLPDWISFDSSERKFSGTVEFGCQEEFIVQVTASDSCSDQVGSFKFKKLNVVPQTNETIGNEEYPIGINFEFQVSEYSFSNPELFESLQYTAKLQDNSDLPDWLNFDDQNLIFNGTGPIGCPAQYIIRLTAEDSCYFESQLFTLDITNDQPILNIQLEDQSYRGGDLIDIGYPENTFTNENEIQEELTYKAELSNGDPLPSWLNFYPDEFKFNGSADSCNYTYSIDLIAEDSCFETTNTFNIEVTNSPIYLINPIDDKYFGASEEINFVIAENTFSTADPNEEFTYQATLSNGNPLPDWLEFISDERRFVGTTEDNCGVNIEIKLKVSDTCYTESDIFKVIVENDPPVVNQTIPDQNYNVMDDIAFTLSEYTFYNPDENEDLTYQATLSNEDPLPDWLNFDPSTLTFDGVAPSGCDQQIEIKVMVEDSCYTASDIFWLYIENNPILIEDGLDDYSIGIGQDLNYYFANVFKNDDANEPLDYTSTLTNGDPLPDWLNFDADQQLYHGDVPIGCSHTISIRLKATDTCSYWSEYVDWDLTVINNPPEVSTIIEDVEFDILQDIDFNINITSFVNQETSIENLVYEAYLEGGSDLPSWIEFRANERRFIGLHDEGCGEKINIEVRAIDSCQSSYAKQIFVLDVQNNQPLINQSIENQVFTANETFDFTFPSWTFTNKESAEELIYDAIQNDGSDLPEWIEFIPGERRFKGQAPIRCATELEILVLTKDTCDDNEITDYFKIDITNDPPVVKELITDKEIHASASFGFEFTHNLFENPDPYEEIEYDPRVDGDQYIPDWLHFDDDKLSFIGTAPSGCPETLNITIYAGDTCYYEEVGQWFILSIINDPPEMNQTIESRSISVMDNFVYQIPESSFIDDEGFGNLEFQANLSNDEPLPDWLTLNENTGKFSGIAPNGCNETLPIHIFAFDTCGQQSDESVFNLTIVNTPPTVFNEIQDQEIVINEDYQYTIPKNTFYNTETSETLSYAVKLSTGDDLPDWLDFDDANRKLTGTPPSQCTETIRIQVRATDLCELNVVSTDYNLQIVNEAPTLVTPIKDQEAIKDDKWTFNFDEETFGNNEDDDSLTYKALLKDGEALPDWLSFIPDKRQFEGITPDEEKTYEIEVFATDSCESNTISTTFVLTLASEDQTSVLKGLSLGFGILAGSLFCCLGFLLFKRKKNPRNDENKLDSFSSTENDSEKVVHSLGQSSNNEQSYESDIDGKIASKSSGSDSENQKDEQSSDENIELDNLDDLDSSGKSSSNQSASNSNSGSEYSSVHDNEFQEVDDNN